MMISMLLMSWTLSAIFVIVNHPLSLGFILLLQTIVISMVSSMLNHDYWFSYILFLVMIGGMLVLFIYMTSVASNEKFKYSSKILVLTLLYFIAFFVSLFTDSYFFSSDTMMISQTSEYQDTNNSKSKYMNFPGMLLMVLLMGYLLASLIAIVKIASLKYGALRQSKS